MRTLAVVVGLLSACLTAAADDNQVIFPANGSAAAKAAASPAGGSSTNSLTLGAAALFAGAGAWLYWRNRRAPHATRGGQALAIEETRSLGNRQFLVVASYKEKKFLLGVCQGRIDLLAPLSEDGAGKGGST